MSDVPEETEMSEPAKRFAEKLLLEDPVIKKNAGMVFAGIVMNHYGFGMMKTYLDVEFSEEEDIIPGALEHIFHILKQETAHGMHMKDLITLLREQVVPSLERDLRIHDERIREIQEQNEARGAPTGFRALDAKLGGGLKKDKVLVLAAEDLESLHEAYSTLLLSLNRQNVPVTRFALGDVEDTLGVTNVPSSWWARGCDSHEKMKEVFAAVKTPILLIDNVSALGSCADDSSIKNVRKLLRAAAKRYHISIVCGARASEVENMTATGNLYKTHACYRKLEEEGEQFLFVEDEKYEEPESEDCDHGSDSEVEGQLAGLPAGAEDGEPEGSGEDRGENCAVGGDSPEGSAEEPHDESNC